MKRLYSLMPLLLLPLVFLFMGYHTGSPGGRTGSPGDNGNNCTACHTGTPAQNATDWITTDIPANGYIGGETYTITATGTHEGVGRFGFELTAEDQEGNKVGDFIITNTTENKLINNGHAVTHTADGITPTGNSKTWQFDWTAPEDVPGNVTFYAAFNAANGNGSNTGDIIYLTDATVSPDVTSVGDVSDEFSFYPNPTNGLVNFNLTDNDQAGVVKIYNQTGQLIDQIEVNGTYGQADLSSRAKGVYFVRFNDRKLEKLIVE